MVADLLEGLGTASMITTKGWWVEKVSDENNHLSVNQHIIGCWTNPAIVISHSSIVNDRGKANESMGKLVCMKSG